MLLFLIKNSKFVSKVCYYLISLTICLSVIYVHISDLEYHSENNNDCEIKIEENGATNHVESADSNNTDSEMEVTGLTLPSKGAYSICGIIPYMLCHI